LAGTIPPPVETVVASELVRPRSETVRIALGLEHLVEAFLSGFLCFLNIAQTCPTEPEYGCAVTTIQQRGRICVPRT
jgi:hypothetical protein